MTDSTIYAEKNWRTLQTIPTEADGVAKWISR